MGKFLRGSQLLNTFLVLCLQTLGNLSKWNLYPTMAAHSSQLKPCNCVTTESLLSCDTFFHQLPSVNQCLWHCWSSLKMYLVGCALVEQRTTREMWSVWMVPFILEVLPPASQPSPIRFPSGSSHLCKCGHPGSCRVDISAQAFLGTVYTCTWSF